MLSRLHELETAFLSSSLRPLTSLPGAWGALATPLRLYTFEKYGTSIVTQAVWLLNLHWLWPEPEDVGPLLGG